MSQLPPAVRLAAAAIALILIATCVATGYAVLRSSSRRRVARWSARQMAALLVAGALPWLVVWLAPIRIVASVRTTGALIGWLLLAALAFGALVLLPIAALLAAGVWWAARRRSPARGVPPNV